MKKSHNQESKTREISTPWIIGLSIACILFLSIILYTQYKNKEAIHPITAETTAVADPEQARLRELEEKERQRLALEHAQEIINREYRNNWKKYVTYKANDFEVGFFGGISNLEITVTNNMESILDEVVVKIDYIKESGDLYESKEVVFNNIQPGTEKTLKAPETNRGIKIKTEINKITARSLAFCFDKIKEKERRRNHPDDPWICR